MWLKALKGGWWSSDYLGYIHIRKVIMMRENRKLWYRRAHRAKQIRPGALKKCMSCFDLSKNVVFPLHPHYFHYQLISWSFSSIHRVVYKMLAILISQKHSTTSPKLKHIRLHYMSVGSKTTGNTDKKRVNPHICETGSNIFFVNDLNNLPIITKSLAS